MWYKFVQTLFMFIFKIVFRLEIVGQENIPNLGAVVIASNHASLLDPPLVGTASSRPVHFMAKQELFVPVLGAIYKSLGAFPVHRGASDRQAIKTSMDILRDNKVLGIFPEGTRSKDGKLGKAGPGALGIASKMHAIVVPAAVVGSNLHLQKSFWPKIKVIFGQPIHFSQDMRLTKTDLEQMTEKMMHSIQIMLDNNKI